jgi:ABC-type transport system involved in multi-copper enzyme maturation permease subunit
VIRALFTIANLTFHEARKTRVLAAALVLGCGFLVFFGTGLHFIHDNLSHSTTVGPLRKAVVLNSTIMSAVYDANFLIVMIATLTPVGTLAGEISSGTIQVLVTKPIRRAVIVLGKWLGCCMVLVIYTLLICGGVLAVARTVTGFTPPGIATALPLIVLQATLLTTLAIAGATRLPALSAGMSALGLYGIALVGGWIEYLGTLVGSATARYIGITASLLVPSEALWRLAAYNLQGPLLRDVQVTPFSPLSHPSPAMVVWAVLYVAVALALAVYLFEKRDL